MNLKKASLWSLGTVGAVLVSSLLVRQYQITHPAPWSSPFQPRQTQVTDPAWLTAKWTYDDQPFKELRKRIYADIPKGLSPEEVAARYRPYEEIARLHPSDPLAQFAWAVAALIQTQLDRRVWHGATLVAADAMGKTSVPESYEYARMRFLVTVGFNTDQKFAGLGKRLLARYPPDDNVAYYLIQILNYKLPQERARGLALASSFVQRKPQSASSYYLRGKANFLAWVATGSKAYGDAAIRDYRKHESMSHLDALSQRQIASLIKDIETGNR